MKKSKKSHSLVPRVACSTRRSPLQASTAPNASLPTPLSADPNPTVKQTLQRCAVRLVSSGRSIKVGYLAIQVRALHRAVIGVDSLGRRRTRLVEYVYPVMPISRPLSFVLASLRPVLCLALRQSFTREDSFGPLPPLIPPRFMLRGQKPDGNGALQDLMIESWWRSLPGWLRRQGRRGGELI